MLILIHKIGQYILPWDVHKGHEYFINRYNQGTYRTSIETETMVEASCIQFPVKIWGF